MFAQLTFGLPHFQLLNGELLILIEAFIVTEKFAFGKKIFFERHIQPFIKHSKHLLRSPKFPKFLYSLRFMEWAYVTFNHLNDREQFILGSSYITKP